MKVQTMAQLAFNGDCRQAFERYATLFDGTVVVMNTFGAHEDKALPPGSVPSGADKVRFAEVKLGDSSLLGNDVNPDDYEPMRGFSIAVHTKSTDDARRIFYGLAEGGEVTTALSKVEWAQLFGMVRDRFGVPWLVLALEA